MITNRHRHRLRRRPGSAPKPSTRRAEKLGFALSQSQRRRDVPRRGHALDHGGAARLRDRAVAFPYGRAVGALPRGHGQAAVLHLALRRSHGDLSKAEREGRAISWASRKSSPGAASLCWSIPRATRLCWASARRRLRGRPDRSPLQGLIGIAKYARFSTPHPPAPSPTRGEGERRQVRNGTKIAI